jgi:hypothetical protein
MQDVARRHKMTEQEGYRKLSRDLEYLYIAETKRKHRIWFHKHKESSPRRVEDYNAGVLAERERIVDLIRAEYSDPEFDELGSFEFTEDIIDLIKESDE